jgi:hypothetical protein
MPCRQHASNNFIRNDWFVCLWAMHWRLLCNWDILGRNFVRYLHHELRDVQHIHQLHRLLNWLLNGRNWRMRVSNLPIPLYPMRWTIVHLMLITLRSRRRRMRLPLNNDRSQWHLHNLCHLYQQLHQLRQHNHMRIMQHRLLPHTNLHLRTMRASMRSV